MNAPTAFPTLHLNSGREMPQLGFGTYLIDNEDTSGIVAAAVEEGFRLIDTAAFYENEQGVGKALAGRHDVFITTKVWNADHGFDETKAAFHRSLAQLGRDEVDLLLIHWPCPQQNRFVDSWKAMIELQTDGRARSIGVSNFNPEHIQRLIDETGVTPAVNQVELHPTFQQRDLRAFHKERGIVTQSWQPLGAGTAMNHPVIAQIAAQTGAEPAAVVLRWHMQNGCSPIPKASSRAHMKANRAAMQVYLDRDQMAQIDALDTADGRRGPDPAAFC
ncbi:aldo/keto reductase [Croceicoccus sp. F390]|uniref:Aldo/keto reductase n=1 Tax=Croceicoccus esteveae TaxID=3075597 RepID=A0ABU2ZHT4_9SPHN|nr:aldo/keto reductase [Croceicoccus sp. F390]MDT0576172.1 aldo/keto reductase [Croceicoccus sp. F390]